MTYQEIIKNINILLVDDDTDYLKMTATFLKQIGYNVDIAANGMEALEKLTKEDYQILLLDFYMPDMTGEEVIEKLRKINQEIIIILQTGFAGQNPPEDMLKRLNIQNYFDKAEGINRLELEIISAVRIVNQQNEIELTKYKNSAMGDLMVSIASEIKQALLSVGAGIEAANMLSDNEKIATLYEKNKEALERTDKILTAVLTSANSENVIKSDEVMTVIDTIALNISKQKNIRYESKLALRENEYIKGQINDIIFIICALIKQIIISAKSNDLVEFVLTDDEKNWYFNIKTSSISLDAKRQISISNKVISNMESITLIVDDNKIILSMLK